MRIVAGRHKGRPLVAPEGRVARPTADRARQALFNILAHAATDGLDGLRVVDCFAGTGALGLEALSQGAAHAVFVENHPASLSALAHNIGVLGEEAACTVLPTDATRLPPAPAPCGVAFLDPPYRSELALPCLDSLVGQGWLTAGGLAVVETAARAPFTVPAGFTLEDDRAYGVARLLFLRKDG